jgi:hypothetical protein
MIPDNLISGIKKYTKAENTTQSIVYVLEDWLRKQNVNKIFDQIEKNLLNFFIQQKNQEI